MLGVLTLQSQHVSSNSVLLYHNGNLLLDSSDNCAKSLLMKCFGFVWYTSSDIFTFCILSTPFVKPVGIKKLYSCVSMRNNSVRMQGWPLPICWELGCSQEPTTCYSSNELCSDQNLTSDFSGLLKNHLMRAALYQAPIFILQNTLTFSPLPLPNK